MTIARARRSPADLRPTVATARMAMVAFGVALAAAGVPTSDPLGIATVVAALAAGLGALAVTRVTPATTGWRQAHVLAASAGVRPPVSASGRSLTFRLSVIRR